MTVFQRSQYRTARNKFSLSISHWPLSFLESIISCVNHSTYAKNWSSSHWCFLKTVFSYCILPLEIYSEVSIQEYTENHELRNIAVNRNQSGVFLSSFDAINLLRLRSRLILVAYVTSRGCLCPKYIHTYIYTYFIA